MKRHVHDVGVCSQQRCSAIAVVHIPVKHKHLVRPSCLWCGVRGCVLCCCVLSGDGMGGGQAVYRQCVCE